MKTKFQRLSFPPFPFYWFPKLKFHSKNKNYWNNHNNNYNNKNKKSKRNNKISTSWFPSNTTQTLEDIHDNYSDNSNQSSNYSQSSNDTSDSEHYHFHYKIDNDIDEFYYHYQEAEILHRIRQMNLPPKSPPSPSAAYSSSRPGPGTAAGGTGTSTNMTSADKQMEERAKRAKELLSMRYKGLKTEQESKHHRKMQLEKQMLQLNLSEENKTLLRQHLETEEIQISKTQRKKVTCADFESLAIIGRGAFGEVRLVRNKTKHKTATTAMTGLTSSSSSSISTPSSSSSSPIKMYALKSMKKEMMVMKNQVGHVKAERDALAEADDNNRWLTMLHYSFTDETHLYMVMEYMPGGDLMSLLIKEDTFSEEVTKFFMAEAAQAIASVHALGYIHRDIKPDNMLLDERGHLKLTDLGLCKKVGDVSPEDHPDVVLEFLKQEETVLGEMVLKEEDDKNLLCIDSMQNHPSSSSSSSSFQPKKPERWTNSKARREMAYSTVGTPDYIAPEVLAAQNGSSGYSYTCAVDWWSLGVIMYECLVGYTPFYAEDPVTTCRKILRWRQCLEIPADKKAQLSAECLDFMSCLLAGPESRIGSSIHGDEFKNGFVQVVQHPWFAGFDWEGLYDREGPLLPSGTHEFPWILEQLKNCPKTDPRFHDLVKKATQNFDTFEDFGSNLDTEDGRKRVERSNLDQFYDYHFRRVPKPNVLSTSKVDLP